jgi:hypothetical protein
VPDPGKFKDQSSFMSSCISQAKREGKDQDQAVAMCLSMWRREKGIPTPPHVKRKQKRRRKCASEILREAAGMVCKNA